MYRNYFSSGLWSWSGLVAASAQCTAYAVQQAFEVEIASYIADKTFLVVPFQELCLCGWLLGELHVVRGHGDCMRVPLCMLACCHTWSNKCGSQLHGMPATSPCQGLQLLHLLVCLANSMRCAGIWLLSWPPSMPP